MNTIDTYAEHHTAAGPLTTGQPVGDYLIWINGTCRAGFDAKQLNVALVLRELHPGVVTVTDRSGNEIEEELE